MYVFGLLSLLSALGVVFAKKSLHSALWLVVTLFTVAVHFALLGADFIAALQILVYAGAIMILVVFVIMLLGLDKSVDDNSFGIPRPVSAMICAGFLALVLFVVRQQELFSDFGEKAAMTKPFLTKDVGRALLTENLVAFEAIGLLLLAAIVGA
ncbi:UNVERIFIED_CONTAM: hypothetical protein GTU68_061867, partial [Idotea baltica]|nr:hypothetical protein [Idotea baltica]